MSKLVTLEQHVKDVKSGKKVFENAFQGVSRMILSDGVETITWAGKKINNFKFFRAPGKHLVGLYEEINSFVSFVKDASEGGSSKEMAFILVGEPGNGKTFFVEYLCNRYREFLSLPENKKDLVQVYLGVIQNRTIEIDGFKWPLDVLIIGTSNNDEFSNFVAERSEAPIIDRCRICYVSHNTDYKLQEKLTSYALGTEKKTTVNGDALHEDPNMNYAASVGVILTRLPHNNKLTPIETMKLAAGDIAGEKSSKTLIEVIDELAQNPDITKHFGQRGLGQRNLGRAIQLLLERNETCEGKCMFALYIFNTLQKVVLTYVHESGLREKYKKDIDDAKKLYRDKIMETMFNAYMDDPEAIKKDVFRYVNMIIGIDAENLGPDKMWKYKDPQTGDLKPLKIDEKFIQSVEARLGLKTREQSDTFRNSVRKIYGQKLSTDRNYDFMDNLELIKAVTDVRLKSDIAGAGSLIGALANRTNEENEKLYTKIMKSMIDKLGYCPTCAVKTIEFFCTYEE